MPLASRLASSAGVAERCPHLVDEQVRLLEGGEVPALVELVPVADVGEAVLGPAPRGAEDLLGEDRQARPAR